MRRPWSPDPPIASGNNVQVDNDEDYNPHRNYPRISTRNLQQEPSDVSVEALDLADYARTLRARQDAGPYPSFPQIPEYPPTPRSQLRPSISRDSLDPPSLTSRNTTQSSNAHSSVSRPQRRPFSLPPSSYPSAGRTRSTQAPQFPEPQIQSADSEIDISHFPVWSRNWYDQGPISSPDIYTPLPGSRLHPTKNISPFDPGYSQVNEDYYSDTHDFIPPSSLGHESTRELLPWSNDPPTPDTPIDPALKEERIRMLEREFGSQKGKGKIVDTAEGFLDENGKPVVGTVDGKGNLVTQGPRKRAATRLLQIILAAAASVPSIYAAVVIKPKESPPPSNKPPAYVLYVVSVLTLLVLLYLFVLRPCCCARKRRIGMPNNPLTSAIMALPVQALPRGKNQRKKKQNGKKGPPQAGDIQVNLIVDPRAFDDRQDESEEGTDEGSGRIPGEYGTGKKRQPRRRGVFEGLAMEEDWKRARSWMKKLAFLDVASVVLWGAVFIFILIGERCPSGGFEGWCNAYNVSTAAACLLCVSFGLSTFFDVKDLHASKASPRSRT